MTPGPDSTSRSPRSSLISSEVGLIGSATAASRPVWSGMGTSSQTSSRMPWPMPSWTSERNSATSTASAGVRSTPITTVTWRPLANLHRMTSQWPVSSGST